MVEVKHGETLLVDLSLCGQHSEASRDMSRTASTWAFNAVRLLFRQAKDITVITVRQNHGPRELLEAPQTPAIVWSVARVFRGIHTVCCLLGILKDGWTMLDLVPGRSKLLL